MSKTPQFNFTKSTGRFIIAGIFIPGFTAIAIFGLQTLITQTGIACEQSWSYVWTSTCITIFTFPIIFYALIRKRIAKDSSIRGLLFCFNLLEYMSIQAFVTAFISDPYTLCYVSDGQNGIEFVPAAWIAIPILYFFSRFFNKYYQSINDISLSPLE